MTFAIIVAAAAAVMLSLALPSGRPEPRRIPVRVRERDPRFPRR